MLSKKFDLLVDALVRQDEHNLSKYGKEILDSSPTQFEVLFVLENVESVARDAWQSLRARNTCVLRRVCQKCPDLRKDVWEYWSNLGINAIDLVELIRQVPEMLTFVIPTLHHHALSREQFESILPIIADAKGLDAGVFLDYWDVYPPFFSNEESLDDSFALYYLYDDNVGPSIKQREAIEQAIRRRPKAVLETIPTAVVLELSQHSDYFTQMLVERVKEYHRPCAYRWYFGSIWSLFKDKPALWLSCWSSIAQQAGERPGFEEPFCQSPVFVDTAWNQFLSTSPDSAALDRIVESKGPFSLPAATALLNRECSNRQLLNIFRSCVTLRNAVLEKFNWSDVEGSENCVGMLQVVFPDEASDCKRWSFQVDGTACKQMWILGNSMIFAISDHWFFDPIWWASIPDNDRSLVSYNEYGHVSPSVDFVSKFEIECNRSHINPMFVAIVVTRFVCEAWVEVDVQFHDGYSQSGFLTWLNSD